MFDENLRESIVTELETFQIPIKNAIFVAEKAAEICAQYFERNVDNFVNDLVAYRLNCRLGEDEPLTEDFLSSYERSRTTNENEGSRRKSQYAGCTPSTKAGSGRKFRKAAGKVQKKPAAVFSDYGIADEQRKDDIGIQFNTDVDDVETMEHSDVQICQTPSSIISEETFSPVGITPSRYFVERSNAGEVVVNYGDTYSLDWSINRKRTQESYCALVKHCASVPVLEKPYQFMNQTPRGILRALDQRVHCMTSKLMETFPEINEQSVDISQKENMIYVCGMIYNGDESERLTRLHPEKVRLRGAKSVGNSISVDISRLSEFSLFSGQIVCFCGRMVGKDKLVAEKVFAGCLPPLATLDLNNLSVVPDRLSVVIAAGPFTLSDGFGYEPLVPLLNYVQQNRPHVLILTGPIVPSNRDDLLTLPMTCQDLFDRILFKILEVCDNTACQLVIGSSAEDVTLYPCYPTPPARVSRPSDKAQPLFVPDPCLLQLGDLVIGVTATDVLFHMSSEEMAVSCDTGSGRMKRLVRHILLQQTFYPLYPPPPDISVEVEMRNVHADLPVQPHILVLPSVLKGFIQGIDNVLAINPGQLSKGRAGGTFCRLEFDKRKLAHENGDVLRCMRAQILRV